MSMNELNTLDIIAAVLVVGALALGYHRGLIAQLVSIVGLFIAYLAAYWLYDDLAPIIGRFIPLDKLKGYQEYAFLLDSINWNVYFNNAVAFAVIFIVVKIGFTVVGRVLHWIASIPGLKKVNKWSGALLALFEVVVLFTIAVLIMSIIPSDSLQKTLSESSAATFVMDRLPELADRLRELWNQIPVESV
ncbi:CvpA family protein [Paenibacillus sp. GYB004]|uniref:CvpA family protein n=1 Tax=Paenibacillus sp. GYB004 TaxID=2994393 RepID=UPI002F96CCC3